LGPNGSLGDFDTIPPPHPPPYILNLFVLGPNGSLGDFDIILSPHLPPFKERLTLDLL
tara:strand:+ start:548 stop:721 length:174 start_codon:yes stop_codon:yes gene_type:complete